MFLCLRHQQVTCSLYAVLCFAGIVLCCAVLSLVCFVVLSWDRLGWAKLLQPFTRCRYKPDGVLVKDNLANISKLTAACARKLMRDHKHGSSGGIDLHAILQVCNNTK